jgi:hypothetical protein
MKNSPATPTRSSSTAAAYPEAASRLVATPHGFVERLAAPGLPRDTVPTYDSSSEVACLRCSHDGCTHFHSAQRRVSRVEAQGFLRYTENTLFTKHSRREMPPAVSGPPLEFDSCHLAVFKFDGVVLATALYDRTAHLVAVPIARAEREQRRREKSEKLSAHMRRRHAASRAPKPISRSPRSATRTQAGIRRTGNGGAR